MTAFPDTCPKCGAKPMHLDRSHPGQYMCDTFVTFHGVTIERGTCFQRQRNQALDALENLTNAARVSEIAFNPAYLEACDVIKKLRGGLV